jgi:RNA polymerase sigma factor (sigma-70 family)
MADKEKYMIKVEGKLVEVTPDVYYAYFRMERQERWQEEKQQGHAVVSYDALDDGETVGMEVVPDLTTPSMEEAVMTREIYEKLHRALDALPKAERELIKALYFEGMTEANYAKVSGMSQTGVSYRLRKILSKLKLLLDIMGSFC